MNILDCMLKTITTVRLQRLWSVGWDGKMIIN